MAISSKSSKVSSPNVRIQDVPNVPTITGVTANIAAAGVDVAFTPAATGGRAAVYRAVSNPGSIQAISYGTSPVTVTGLTNNTSYTFTVQGETSTGATSGTGSASGAIIPTFGSMELISTQILSATASSVTFSAIPQGYKHLQLRIAYQQTTNDSDFILRFNGDSGTNYSRHSLESNSPSVVSGNLTSQTGIEVGYNYSASYFSTSSFAGHIIDILDYTNTSKNKALKSFYGIAYSSGGKVSLNSGLWVSTAAVTSFTLNANYYLGSSFVAGSRFSLYGVKA
jgi:hypothetical protein